MENSDAKNIGIDINVDASGMDEGFANAQEKTESFTTTLDKNKDAAEKVANKYSDVALVLTGAFALAATAAVASIVTLDIKSIDLADNLGKLSQRTGTSVEDLAGLKFAADQSGASLETVARASKKLSTEMVQNPALFARMGVTAKDSTGALVQLADVFEKMPAGINKTAFASKLLGDKLGAEMIPFLNQGSESLANLIEQGKKYYPITEESARQAEIFNDQLDELKLATSAAGIELANILLPSMVKTTTAMTELSREGHPVLALFRGFAGIGQIPWDLLFPPEDLKKAVAPDGMIDDLTKKLKVLEHERESIRAGGWGLINTDKIDREITTFQNQIETIKRHRAELEIKPSANKPTATDPTDFESNDKLLEQTRRFDEKMVDSHKSAFDRMIDDWVELQNKMIAAGAYGSKERSAHEAAYTIFVNEENEKRIAAADKAAEAEAVANNKIVTAQEEKFTRMQEQADIAYGTAQERENARYEAKMGELERERKVLEDKYLFNLRSEAKYNAAKESLQRDHLNRMSVSSRTFGISMVQFEKMNNLQKTQNFASALMQMTAIGAQNNRELFEINKIASYANATISGFQAVQDSFAFGAKWGGPVGGAAMAAIAIAATVANIAAIASTSYGSGGASTGGAGIPSMSTAPGIPVAPQPAEPAPIPVAGVAAQATRTVNISMTGEAQLYTAQSIREQLIPALNEAAGDGVEINVVMT
ncbi:MAG: hypothetical protein B7Y56_03400 [Gallionellales bacterium 35-53-114]|jgi:hypothetical protein|nr:MAG: hypothetical protein B7Y56_03400 [Gallionellales bacterium 35-53-114]OYZ65151.1 MAG: hypothetical protein B7Y04_00560 [Gallionellales bacterium 24-53-125]OZB08059.1 MAG: hypothetical protein B7X61_11010 [Gallionellales bacterium 39-52-133]HQS59963.1 hypothetical protein [Gallionellaceae bacterium]HQS76655.1 hypothetical protein [Gallionellaceae bacterium]